jgi:hypothetical protein
MCLKGSLSLMDVEFGMNRNWKPLDLSALALRLALASSFLSAVADRFGIWGKSGEPRVSWGDFATLCRLYGTTDIDCAAASGPLNGLDSNCC